MRRAARRAARSASTTMLRNFSIVNERAVQARPAPGGRAPGRGWSAATATAMASSTGASSEQGRAAAATRSTPPLTTRRQPSKRGCSTDSSGSPSNGRMCSRGPGDLDQAGRDEQLDAGALELPGQLAQVLRRGLAGRGHRDGVGTDAAGHGDDVVQPADRHAGGLGDPGPVGGRDAGGDDLAGRRSCSRSQPGGQLERRRRRGRRRRPACVHRPCGPQPAQPQRAANRPTRVTSVSAGTATTTSARLRSSARRRRRSRRARAGAKPARPTRRYSSLPVPKHALGVGAGRRRAAAARRRRGRRRPRTARSRRWRSPRRGRSTTLPRRRAAADEASNRRAPSARSVRTQRASARRPRGAETGGGRRRRRAPDRGTGTCRRAPVPAARVVVQQALRPPASRYVIDPGARSTSRRPGAEHSPVGATLEAVQHSHCVTDRVNAGAGRFTRSEARGRSVTRSAQRSGARVDLVLGGLEAARPAAPRRRRRPRRSAGRAPCARSAEKSLRTKSAGSCRPGGRPMPTRTRR